MEKKSFFSCTKQSKLRETSKALKNDNTSHHLKSNGFDTPLDHLKRALACKIALKAYAIEKLGKVVPCPNLRMCGCPSFL